MFCLTLPQYSCDSERTFQSYDTFCPFSGSYGLVSSDLCRTIVWLMESLHQPKGSFTTAIWGLFLLTLVTIMVLSVVNKNLSKFIFFDTNLRYFNASDRHCLSYQQICMPSQSYSTCVSITTEWVSSLLKEEELFVHANVLASFYCAYDFNSTTKSYETSCVSLCGAGTPRLTSAYSSTSSFQIYCLTVWLNHFNAMLFWIIVTNCKAKNFSSVLHSIVMYLKIN